MEIKDLPPQQFQQEILEQPQMEYDSVPVSNIPNDRASLLDKIKPDAIVETLKYKLMGYELENGKWIKKDCYKDRALSENGAREISNLMLSASSQNVSLSNLDDSDIRRRVISKIRTLNTMILKNWKEWNITGIDQINAINEIVLENTFVTLKQPEHAGIRGLIKNTTTENFNVGNRSNDGGSWWNPFRRGGK